MKKILKRLLSVMLALVMVVGMVPVSNLTITQAATFSKGTRIYFNTNNVDNFTTAGATPSVLFKDGENSTNGTWVLMTKVTGTDTYYYAEVDRDNVTHVQFRRSSSDNANWNSGTGILALEDGKNCFTIDSWNKDGIWTNSGSWSAYSESGSGESGGDSGSDSNVIYLDASETDFDTAGATFAVEVSSTSLGKTQIPMTKVYPNNSSDHYYKVEIPSGYTHIAFLRCDANGNTGWGNLVNYNAWPQIPTDGTNCYVASGYNTNGKWTTYSADESVTSNSIFYVQTDLVDYLNDERVDNAGDQNVYRTDNQGDWVSVKYTNGSVNNNTAPYSYLNQVISERKYATPLYFGPLYLIQMRYGRTYNDNGTWYSLFNWNTGANVATLTDQGANNFDASVQGLVGKSLKNGNLTDTSGTTELLYFSKTAADTYKSNGKKVMEYYSGLEFPFNAQYDSSTGVTTYSYDSASDKAVYYNYSDKKLYTSNDHVKNLSDGKNGYFPLNEPGDSGSAVNMGFGTKFTIPFTVSDDGKINGKDVTFNFTGDDDVWVFIDDQLVLDMGGAHTMSTGSINFATLKATVNNAYTVKTSQTISSGNTWELSNFKDKGLTNYLSDNNTVERDKASSTGKVETDFPTDLANKFKTEYDNNKAGVHTLTMFYMERGMFDSNMSISFTMSPIPSGLVVSADLDTSNINPGLVSSVENVDEFSYSVVAKNLKENSDVVWDSYVLTDHNGVSTTKETDESTITGVKTDRYANTFLNGKNNAFIAGTGFTITEKIENTVFQYDTDATCWKLYDADNSYNKIGEKIDLTSTFDMGNAQSDPKNVSYNYSLNYVNKIKVGDLSLTKMFPGSDDDTEYEFTLLLDLDGEGSKFTLQPYSGVKYGSNKDSGGETNADGKFTVQAGECVTFSGIPSGATYSIEETAPTTDDAWKISSITGAETDSENKYLAKGSINESQNVTFTNQWDSIELDKVIYIESKESSDVGTTYTVNDSSDTDGDNKVTVTTLETTDLPDGITATTNNDGSVTYKTGTDDTGITVSVSDGSVVLKTENAGKEYVIPYTGTKDSTTVYGEITVFTYKATNKVYVFDYGLKSDLTTTNDNKDGLFEGGTFYNTNTTGTANDTTATFSEITGINNSQTTIAAEAGTTVTINADGSSTGSVIFTPVAFMDTVENYTYTANIAKNGTTFDSTNPETGTVVTGTIKVMPASVVYYEDNFNSNTSSNDSAVKIIYTGLYSSTEELSFMQSNDQTEQYGYDDAYNTTENQQDSGGSSTLLTAKGYNTKAIFTFTGDGFDILARTTVDTAGIVYTIEKIDEATGEYSLYRMGAVDTYYTNGYLYQLPVIHEEVDYGTYCVTLGIKQTGDCYTVLDENKNVVSVVDTRKYAIYLDGIRIYNPLGVDGDAEYIASEQNATVSVISKLVVGNGTVTETGIRDEYGSTIDGQVINGADVAIVGYDSENGILEPLGSTQTEVSTEDSGTNTTSVLTYLNAGPNNEVYVDETAALAFVVKATDETTNTLQIEAKLVDTSNSEGSERCKGIDLRVLSKKDDSITETVIENIKSSTAMYYSINVEEDCIALDGGYYLVVILGNSDLEDEGTHSLSFSNLKYKNYTIGNPYDTSSGYDASAYIEALEETTTSKFVSIDSMTGLKKNTWYKYKHAVTLTENVFAGFQPVYDENGDPKVDENGDIVYEVEVDENGDPVYDENGDPVKVQRDPEFKMYYTNAAGDMVEITVKAKPAENSDGTYSDTKYVLQFKTPNAKGNFPIEIHYVVTSCEADENGKIVEKAVESTEYISTTMITR